MYVWMQEQTVCLRKLHSLHTVRLPQGSAALDTDYKLQPLSPLSESDQSPNSPVSYEQPYVSFRGRLSL